MPNRATWFTNLLASAVALLLVCLGGAALQQSVPDDGSPGTAAQSLVADHSGPHGSHLRAPVLAETLDSEEAISSGYEHLNARALGLFLVSLGLLLGAGLVGHNAEWSLLNTRLSSVPSLLTLVKSPLSALEVFLL